MDFFTFLYLDPGAGSYVIQLIAAFFLTASASLVVFWNKIKSKFSNRGETDGK